MKPLSSGSMIVAAAWILIQTTAGLAEVEPIRSSLYEPIVLPAKQPPNFMHPCQRRHKKFNLCVKSTLQKFFEAVKYGSGELGFPPIEPLKVPEIGITEGSGDVKLDMKFYNVSILGLGQAKVISVRSNLEDNKFEISIKYPYVNFTGDFSGEGSVKTFPIVGRGPFFFNMSDVSSVWMIYLAGPEGNRDFYVIDDFKIDITAADILTKFGSVIDEDVLLGQMANEFINENAQEIFKAVKPSVTEALSEIFTELANRIFSSYPAETLLPP